MSDYFDQFGGSPTELPPEGKAYAAREFDPGPPRTFEQERAAYIHDIAKLSRQVQDLTLERDALKALIEKLRASPETEGEGR